MTVGRPHELLAGFHANVPDVAVPELRHAGEQWASSGLFVDHHEHAVWELYFQAEGVSRWRAATHSARAARVYELAPGGFFAAAPGITHQMHERARGKHHFFFAAVDLEAVFERLPGLRESWRQHEAVWTPHGESLHQPFRHLVREIALDLPHRAAALRLALDSLVIAATRLLEQAEPISLIQLHPAALHARELMESQPGRAWSVEELARAGGLSPSHMAHVFSREIGMSPRQFLLRSRLQRARSLLETSNLSVTQIALETGFASGQHFASAFRRETGVSAREYRSKSCGAPSAVAPKSTVLAGQAEHA